ncbi:ABC transporter ATP-binding protein [Corynebacterium phocae]|uniref:ABC-type quaternary amine transporter n=1 Tax=Corynebacterium phocae TaxID=161895 RepID=A0A1L7D5B8_9CORY|nr:ATP-binding cassette domain-containing protein [Corynebacterium phocae]APT93339.1 ABC transporter ATP-binding protein [Corynebacterium phocae]KAA8721671.1 ATP-binding cassette domain-containing protein [Corynebacterium phocae]
MIDFNRVTVTYPGTAAPAVEDFSFHFARGKTTALVGPSGCGKTTLLRCVNRMVEPASGAVSIGGENIAGRNPVQLRRSIGYVMQNSGLLPHVTALENVAAVARLSGASKVEARECAAQWLETVHVDPALFKRYPGELSGGQAQRVGVARGLVADPDIVLMDEPFGAVDPVVRRELQQEVLGLQERMAKTIIMVTHDIEEAFYLGDEIVLLSDHAHIEQHGTAEEFITRPANEIVEHFVGMEHRKVRVAERDGKRLVVDAQGNIVALLED